MARSMVSRWPRLLFGIASRPFTSVEVLVERLHGLAIALHADDVGQAVVEFGDALLKFAQLRMMARVVAVAVQGAG